MFIALQSFRPRTFHAREKKFSKATKRKTSLLLSEMPPFLLAACQKCPEFGEKKKNLSRYQKAGMQTAVFALRFF
jgi:hypothetical protein